MSTLANHTRIARAAVALALACATTTARAAPLPNSSRTADEAAIRAILHDSSAGISNPHISPTLDWENAFGIRYTNLAKRDAFYGEVVKPLQIHNVDTTLEVKVKFIKPDVAVADEYWHTVGQLDVATHKPGPDRWGRTTYIFTREHGQWSEILERVADLRLAYYKHYDAMPKPVSVSAAILNRYAGDYEFTDDHKTRTIAVQDDHLTIASKKRTRIAIPTSSTDFLVFDPGDLAEYSKLHFDTNKKAGISVTMADEIGEVAGTLVKVK